MTPRNPNIKTIVCDIDGTICSVTDGDYVGALPFPRRIMQLNTQYRQGHKIILYTARGMGRTNNSMEDAKNLFLSLTIEQLNSWGVLYHELHFGKPSGDIYLDDKGFPLEEFFDDDQR